MAKWRNGEMVIGSGSRAVMALLVLGGCQAEPNITQARPFSADHCPLQQAEVYAHATVEEGVAPTVAERDALQGALASWPETYVGELRNIQSGAVEQDVVIGVALGEVGEVQVDRVTFHSETFDRSGLPAEWDEVEDLPCDHARLVAPATLSLQFGSGPAVEVEGELELWTGAIGFRSLELSFEGSAASVTLADHHAILSSFDAPSAIAVGASKEAWGLIEGGGARWVEFGTALEAASD